MSKHAHKAGTQGQPKPLSAAELQRHMQPGPKARPFRNPAVVKNNIFNTDPRGAAPVGRQPKVR